MKLKSILLFLLCVMGMYAQGSVVKSMSIEPEESKEFAKNEKFKTLFKQGTEILGVDVNNSYRIALDLQSIAIKQNKLELTFLADYFLAKCYYFYNNAPKAIELFEKIHHITKTKRWHKAEVKVDIYVAMIYQQKKNYALAEKYFIRALQRAQEFKLNRFILEIHDNLGFMLVIKSRGVKSDKEIAEHFIKGLSLATEQNDVEYIALFNIRLGLLGKNGEPCDSTNNFVYKAIQLIKKNNLDEVSLISAYKALGDAYYNMAKNDSALTYYIKLFEVEKTTGQNRVIATSACDVAYMYGLMHRDKGFKAYEDSANFYAKKDISGDAKFYVYKWMADIYGIRKENDMSAKYYRLYAQALDSVLRSGNSEAMITAGLESEFNGKISALQLKQEKEKEIEQKEKEYQKFISRVYLIGLIVFLVFSLIIFREFRVNKKQKKIISQQHDDVRQQKHALEIKNKEITDSINYALRIQSALLPSQDQFLQGQKGSFVFYKPKDIVSGDFYWEYKKGDFLYVACGDCTGHGVPGALMSVLGINLLTDIIEGERAKEPCDILNLLRSGIIRALHRDIKIGEYKDGMDISLLKIDVVTQKAVFSGANNGIYHITQKQLIEYKADAQPVGLAPVMTPFNQLVFECQKGDFIVMYTDGFADQFGGSRNKKFMYKTFKKMLLEGILNCEDMNYKLRHEFNAWKGSLEQVDDVCIIGISI